MNINFGTLIPILIGILAGGMGSVLFILAWRRKRKEDISKTWQPAPGVILTSEIKEHNTVDPADASRTIITPIVRYQYTCAGKSFNGYRISFNTVELQQGKGSTNCQPLFSWKFGNRLFRPASPGRSSPGKEFAGG